VKGAGNQIDFGARIYDSRTCKFLSIDPLADKYPDLGVYVFAANNPIKFIDVFRMGPGDPERKGWKEYIYTAVIDFPFYTDVGKENWKVLKAAVMAPTLATMNGYLGDLSFGLLNRSAEDIGLNEQYKKPYDQVSFVVGISPKPIPGGGSGSGMSPGLAYSSNGLSVLTKSTLNVFTSSVRTSFFILSSTSDKTSDNESSDEINARYDVPAEHAKSGKSFIGGLATFTKSNGYFATALDLMNPLTGERYTHKGTPTGREVFGMPYNEVLDKGGKIKAIIGNWSYGSNLAKLNELLRRNIPLEEAALQTFTGMQVKDRGFTQVKRIGGKLNADGITWDKVNIEFTRPSSN
jgi:hypothetical protein